MPPRVVFMIDSLGWGGAERLLLAYLPHVRELGWDPVVCVMQERSGNPVADEIRRLGVPVDTVPVERVRDLTAVPRLVAYLRRLRPAVVHTQLEFADGLGSLAARIAGVPCVSTQHTIYEPRRWTKSWARVRLSDLVVGGLSSAILAVSDEARRHYGDARPYPARKLVTVRNGVDLEAFAANAREGPDVRREVGIPRDAPVLATVAVLRPDKGIPDMVAALPSVLATAPTARYLVVGDGPDRERIAAAAARHGVADRVILAGSRTDIPRVLAACDVFVLPTRAEALPTVLAEAAAAGVPIVASAVGGVPEMCVDDRNGILVPPADPAALAAACARIVSDPALAARLGAGGREVARERYDIRSQVALLLEIYRRVARR